MNAARMVSAAQQECAGFARIRVIIRDAYTAAGFDLVCVDGLASRNLRVHGSRWPDREHYVLGVPRPACDTCGEGPAMEVVQMLGDTAGLCLTCHRDAVEFGLIQQETAPLKCWGDGR